VSVPGLRPRNAADLERARQKVGWIDDDDLRDADSKSKLGATLLGLFTWGGGQLYVGDGRAGAVGIGALIAMFAMTGSVLPAGVSGALYWIVGAASAAWSYRRARSVNRFVSIRNELALREGPGPAAYRLLAAAAVVNPALAAALPPMTAPGAAHNPGRHAPLVEQLRKLAALQRAGILNPAEAHDRKIDLLTEAVPATRAELDELLYALLPLADEGVLGPDDFEFLKQIGASR